MKYLEFFFFMLQRGLIKMIPMKLLYVYSGIISFFLLYVFRYRLQTVKQNLTNSFPEKNRREINDIVRKFYRNLSDITIESIKGYSLGISTLQKRYQFKNIEIANRFYEKNQDIILALSHYCNWEWGAQVAGSVFRHSLFAFYKPLSNNLIDKKIMSQRAKRKITLIPADKPKLPARPEGGKPIAWLFISDQNPASAKVIWTKFLNQYTACSRGIEIYARHYNLPVIYVDIQRIKRGFYTVELEELVIDSSNTKTGEITEKYMRKLEPLIIRKPEDWLWSHRRWKRHPSKINVLN